MKISILGAGVYGMALGGVLMENGYEVVYYDPIKAQDNSEIYADLAGALAEAEVVVLCVPSEVAPELLVQLPKDKFLIVATKGFLTEKPFAEFKDWAVLSGGGFAEDIENQKHTVLTATNERLVEMFATDYLEIELTDDCKGVLMCGALKNVYALWAGYCVIKPGTEAHEKYLKDVADEMRTILLANEANPLTVDLHCGVDDLRMTCGPGSRNFAYGMELMEDSRAKPKVTVEGLTVLERIERGEIKLPKNLPCLESLIKKSEEWKLQR